MRRRPKDPADSPWPAWLVRYRPEDWSRRGCHPECAYWEALSQWNDTHPANPVELAEHGPDGPWHPELV